MSYLRSYHQEEVKKKRFDLELIKKLLSLLGAYRGMLLLAVILLVMAKGVEAVVPLFLGQITRLMLADKGASQATLSTIINHSFLVVFLLSSGYILDSISVLLKSWCGQKVIFNLRNKVYTHILRLPLCFYNKNPTGRLITRTIHDIDQLNQMLSESVVPMIGNLFLFFGILIGMTILDWKVAVVFAALVPFAFFHVNYFRVNQRRCYSLIRSIVSAMNIFVQEHLMGSATIRKFGLQKRERQYFDEINEDHATAYKETIHYYAFFYAGIDLLQSFSLIAIFAALVFFTSGNAGFDAGVYFSFSLYALMLFRPLADLAERYNEMQSAIASAERIFDILDEEEEVESGSIDQLKGIDEIVFNDVWFAYEKEDWVLKGLSFSLRKGESVALIGPTGSGKTSVMSLLLRFYDFQKGSITINGRDIRKYSLSALREQFSVVLQDPVIFSGTLEENISLGNPLINSEVVIEKLEMQDFKRDFSKGGGFLSVGQMQLISIARAMAYNRSVFMLDEATANIDSKTEEMIQTALKYLIEESTSLVIAHRLSTIKDIKRILVLSEGSLIEEGSHQQLLKKKGLYEKLYRLQFLDGLLS